MEYGGGAATLAPLHREARRRRVDVEQRGEDVEPHVGAGPDAEEAGRRAGGVVAVALRVDVDLEAGGVAGDRVDAVGVGLARLDADGVREDRKSTRLNSRHIPLPLLH